MRIGLVIDYYKPHAVGGAERSTRELALALASRGHDVTVLTPNYGAAPEEDDAGVRVCRYWFPRRFEPGRMAPAFWIKNPLYYSISGRAIAGIARRRQLEILHAQNTFVQITTYRAARRVGIPCVATLRDLNSLCAVGHLCSVDYDPDHLCRQSYSRCVREFLVRYWPDAGFGFRTRLVFDSIFKKADLLWRQRALMRYSRIIFVSNGLREVYLRHGFQAPAERLAVAYNLPPDPSSLSGAVAPLPAEWNLPAAAPVVAYAGKLSLGKGAHILLDAIPRVVERHADVVFVLAGRATPQVKIPAAIPARNIRVVGQVPTAQVYALLRRSSLFVLPSVWPEPLSSAVLEALAFGVPVIGTRCGGTPEQIVERENGWLVERGDAGALAERIAAALSDPDSLTRMSRRCVAFLRERFAPEKIVNEVLAVYQAAISESIGGGQR
jgi:glycosyltransferase involved in cell wall biosynthesis